MLVRNDVVPLYIAEMDALPTANFVVVNWAAPLTSAAHPRFTVPWKNVTVPVGMPLNCGATVAVKVIDCP